MTDTETTLAAPRRILWINPQENNRPACATCPEAQRVACRWVHNCREGLELMPAWPPHLLVLDTPDGPTPPCTWDSLLSQELPTVDPYRPGGAWYQTDDIPRVLPLLFLTPGMPGPGDLPPAWRLRVHCLPRFQVTAFLQAWLTHPLHAPATEPSPLLIVDFIRQALWIQGTVLPLPPRTLAVLRILIHHHPQPLMAATIARHMHQHGGWRTTETGVRTAIQALRVRLQQETTTGLLVNQGEGYALDLGPWSGDPTDRIWFWADADAWWSPRTSPTNFQA